MVKNERFLSRPKDSGIIPLNALYVKPSLSSDDKFPSEGGIFPLKLLLKKPNTFRFDKRPSKAGISPVSWLSDISTNRSLEQADKLEGISPLMELLAREFEDSKFQLGDSSMLATACNADPLTEVNGAIPGLHNLEWITSYLGFELE
ncbi:hypothetical protein GOBAR_AA32004 [Gossypium barbadense]|uniref:Uncharacterized protein n=1 Tax=Gossypium barbadense TaxID=3634 RepID=A0A2P5WC79_GOSBA|nr:hypothetical protein GOBAR_AA32004 [Gossypium barbadense]